MSRRRKAREGGEQAAAGRYPPNLTSCRRIRDTLTLANEPLRPAPPSCIRQIVFNPQSRNDEPFEAIFDIIVLHCNRTVSNSLEILLVTKFAAMRAPFRPFYLDGG
jgi:hypothetical protein